MSLAFPLPDPPPFGQPLELRPGLIWLRLPLNIGLDHINLWLLAEKDGGWSLIDCGLPSRDIRALWETMATEVIKPGQLRRLIVTHHHPDHIGMAGWLVERFGVTVETTLPEFLSARALATIGLDQHRAAATRFYTAAGGDEALLTMVGGRGNFYSEYVPNLPAGYRRIDPGPGFRMGDRSWTVLTGEGHAPGMAMFWCEDEHILIAADQVLPTISPNIGVWAGEPEADPLARFLAGFPALAALPDDTLVLPSHGLPFQGLQERLGVMEAHHHERLDAALEACTGSTTAFGLLPVLFRRPLEGPQVLLAIAESLAHLHYLKGKGLVTREMDAKGVHQFRRA